VTWTHTSDLPAPWRWLTGGELLMTNGMSFPEDGDAAYTAGGTGHHWVTHHWVTGWALEVRFRGRSVLTRPKLELVPTLFVEHQAATVKCGEATKEVCGVGSD
jgi:hypothetical protein